MEKGILIYDVHCPLCVWYTNQFVRFNLLQENERLPFHEAVNRSDLKFDTEKAQNKIAYIQPESGKVIYGIDSLLSILGKRFRWIAWIGKLPVIHWLLSILYAFISYNRKVIIPVSCDVVGSCAPSRNWFWRIVFVVVIGLGLSVSVTHYFTVHLGAYFIGNPVYGDLFYFFGQFAFQGLVFWMFKQRNFYDYIGQIAFVSFLGGLLLGFFDLGLVFFDELGFETELLVGVCYGIVYLFMVYEHARRTKLLGFSKILTISWIVYRLLLYPVAFKFL